MEKKRAYTKKANTEITGKRIHEMLNATGLSPVQLAGATQVSPKSIYGYLDGENISPIAQKKIRILENRLKRRGKLE